MLPRSALVALAMLCLAGACTAEPHANYVLIYPNSTARISVDGSCRTISNRTRGAIAWFPTGSAQAFESYTGYPDHILTEPCTH